jgi:hypothetical protein
MAEQVFRQGISIGSTSQYKLPMVKGASGNSLVLIDDNGNVGWGAGSGGGGSTPQNLSQTLANGNDAGSNNIIMNPGYSIGITPNLPDDRIGITFNSTNLELGYNNSELPLTHTNIKIGSTSIIASSNRTTVFPGIQYDTDYSANYTLRSLVDKEYVDDLVGSPLGLGDVLDISNVTNGNSILLSTDWTAPSCDAIKPIANENSITSEFTFEYGGLLNVPGSHKWHPKIVSSGEDNESKIRVGLDFLYISSSHILFPNGPRDIFSDINLDPDKIVMTVANFTNNSGITHTIGSTAHSVSGMHSGFAGIQYDTDYSANYTLRSLVDKEYVDDLVSISSGIGSTGISDLVTKWNSGGTGIVNSLIKDNGTRVGIGDVETNVMLNIIGGVSNTIGLNSFASTVGIKGGSFLENGSGIEGYANAGYGVKGTSSASDGFFPINVGVKGYAYYSEFPAAGSNIGGEFIATGGVSNYSLKLQDGTQANGKFLKSVSDDGHANWASLAFSDLPTKTQPKVFQVACSDEVTALTAGVSKITFRSPFAMNLSSVRASLTIAQATGSIFTVDIRVNGTSILSTKLTIDNGQKTSVTATTQPVISNFTIGDDAEIIIDILQIGDGSAKGLKVTLLS